MYNETRKENNFLFNVYSCILLAILFLPVIKYDIPYYSVALFSLLFAFFYFLKYRKNKEDMDFFLKMSFYTVAITLLYFLIAYPMNLEAASKEFILIYRTFIPFLIFNYARKKNINKNIIVIFFFAIMVFIMFSTLKALNENSLISRELAQGIDTDYLMNYRKQNVGGFSFCYLFLLIIPITLYFLFCDKHLFFKLLMAAVLVLEFTFVFKTQYVTLILCCVIGACTSVITLTKKNYMKGIFISISVIALLSTSNILMYVINHTDSMLISGKFYRILSLFSGNTSAADVTSRVGLISDAFILFLKSPIWGNTREISSGIYSFELSSHSTFFELLSLNGIIGCVVYYIVHFTVYFRIVKCLQDYQLRIYRICFFSVIILSLINPIHYLYDLFITLYLILPLILTSYRCSRIKGEVSRYGIKRISE